MIKETQNAIVIGSGFGGIAAALLLRAMGYRVSIFERLDQIGGRARTFKKNGYSFDAGPTVITAPFLFDELFTLFNKNLHEYIELNKVEPWYRYEFYDGSRFDYGGSIEDTLNEIGKFNEKDRDGYIRLLEQSEKIFDVGFSKLADQPFSSSLTMLKQIPSLVRLGCYRTVWQFAKKYLQDERLRRAFSIQPLLVGGNPFDTTCIYSLIHYLERKWGVFYPTGGTTSLVNALGKLAKEEGINIHLNSEVKSINIENNTAKGVTLASGEKFYSNIVVCNSDPAFTYKKMIDKSINSVWSSRKLSKLKYSMGLYVLYFGTNKMYEDIQHHTIIFGKRYRKHLNDIFKGNELSEDLSLYLHRPTATDKTLAPNGHDAFYVLTPVPNLQYLEDWSKKRHEIKETVLKILEARLLPNLKQHIDCSFDFTPAEFQEDYLSTWGAGFSIAPLFTQSAYFRFHNQAESIDKLYFVGAGTHPGAGVPGVLTSAKVLENLLKKKSNQTNEVRYAREEYQTN